MKSLSPEAADELRRLAHSADLKRDMAEVARNRRDHCVNDGVVDVDAYIEFVTSYNEFISHEPKRFVRMIGRDMRL